MLDTHVPSVARYDFTANSRSQGCSAVLAFRMPSNAQMLVYGNAEAAGSPSLVARGLCLPLQRPQ